MKKIVYMGFGIIYSVRHPLGVLECILRSWVGKRGITVCGFTEWIASQMHLHSNMQTFLASASDNYFLKALVIGILVSFSCLFITAIFFIIS